jgi:5-methylcytosine-specific restriction endonuclease McrA
MPAGPDAERRERHAARQRAYRQQHPDRVRASQKRWVEANPDAVKARKQRWKEANPGRVRPGAKRWKQENPDRVRAGAQLWREKNPEATRASRHRYRARKRAAEGTHSAEELKALFERQGGKCVYCRTKLGKRYHADHIKPLSKGGSNWISNIQLSCAPCNLSKQAFDPITFAQRLGRLL